MIKTKLCYLSYLMQNILKHYISRLTLNLAFSKMSSNIMEETPSFRMPSVFLPTSSSPWSLASVRQSGLPPSPSDTVSGCLLNPVLDSSKPFSSLSPESTRFHVLFLCLQTFLGSLLLTVSSCLLWHNRVCSQSGPGLFPHSLHGSSAPHMLFPACHALL